MEKLPYRGFGLGLGILSVACSLSFAQSNTLFFKASTLSSPSDSAVVYDTAGQFQLDHYGNVGFYASRTSDPNSSAFQSYLLFDFYGHLTEVTHTNEVLAVPCSPSPNLPLLPGMSPYGGCMMTSYLPGFDSDPNGVVFMLFQSVAPPDDEIFGDISANIWRRAELSPVSASIVGTNQYLIGCPGYSGADVCTYSPICDYLTLADESWMLIEPLLSSSRADHFPRLVPLDRSLVTVSATGNELSHTLVSQEDDLHHMGSFTTWTIDNNTSSGYSFVTAFNSSLLFGNLLSSVSASTETQQAYFVVNFFNGSATAVARSGQSFVNNQTLQNVALADEPFPIVTGGFGGLAFIGMIHSDPPITPDDEHAAIFWNQAGTTGFPSQIVAEAGEVFQDRYDSGHHYQIDYIYSSRSDLFTASAANDDDLLIISRCQIHDVDVEGSPSVDAVIQISIDSPQPNFQHEIGVIVKDGDVVHSSSGDYTIELPQLSNCLLGSSAHGKLLLTAPVSDGTSPAQNAALAWTPTFNANTNQYSNEGCMVLAARGDLIDATLNGIRSVQVIDDIFYNSGSSGLVNGGGDGANGRPMVIDDYGDALISGLCHSSDDPNDAHVAFVAIHFEPCYFHSCDYDQSGVNDQGDVDALANIGAGISQPGRCRVDPDFNQDGVFDQGDIDALINAITSGTCP